MFPTGTGEGKRKNGGMYMVWRQKGGFGGEKGGQQMNKGVRRLRTSVDTGETVSRESVCQMSVRTEPKSNRACCSHQS